MQARVNQQPPHFGPQPQPTTQEPNMSAIQTPLANRPQHLGGYVAVALGALIAVGVAVLFLTLAGATHQVRATATIAHTSAPTYSRQDKSFAGVAISSPSALSAHTSAPTYSRQDKSFAGVAIAASSAQGTRTAAPTYTRQDKSYGALP
jgi:hypothetical protein